MVKASGQIEQTLAQLQNQTVDIAEELESLYQSYHKALSEAVQRKLALAAYHLCTQIYPESFLALKTSQRAKLQRLLQQLGIQMHSQLIDKWAEAKKLSRKPPQVDGLSIIKQLFLRLESESEEFSEDDEEEDDGLDDALDELVEASSEMDQIKSKLLQNPLLMEELSLDNADDASDGDEREDSLEDSETDGWEADALLEDQPLSNTSMGASMNQPLEDATLQDGEIADDFSSYEDPNGLAYDTSEGSIIAAEPRLEIAANMADTEAEDEPAEPLKPVHLMRQQLLMEKAIRDVLKAISETANYMLQQAEVVPELPKPLLAAAAESDGLSQMPMKAPNLLKISIKVFHGSSSDDSDSGKKRRKPPKIMQLDSLPECVVIQLRLSEIEFAETAVSIWRSRIREKNAKLKQLANVYQKAQRELAIANAEEAWRATWVKE